MLSFAVLLVAVCCALVACRFRGEAVYTTVSEDTVQTVETVPPVTVTVGETEESTPKEETTVLPETTEIPETTETTEITFTSVEEADGVRRVENFIFYETDTPEYRLAHLLFLEVPPVVKVVETTTEEPQSTDAPVETTVETTAETVETTAETTAETYVVEGSAAIYYKDLLDGETVVFAPNKVFFGASLIKIVYVYALLQLADREEIDLAETLVYTEDMYVEGSGEFDKVEDGTEFTVQNLISRTVRKSDNTAYAMLQARFGTDFFCGVLAENGIAPTRYGAWWRGTPMQYGAFFEALYTYLVSEDTHGKWLADEMVASTQSVMLQRALSPERVAHKYGWDEDSYCDGAIVLGERPYVVVFLSNMDEGHMKHANTRFIYAVGAEIKQMHDAKPVETTVEIAETTAAPVETTSEIVETTVESAVSE